MRQNMKRFASVGLVVLTSYLLPLTSEGAGYGTTSASFLKIGLGARPAAMGFAFAAISDDLNAIQYNPAGLSQLKGNNVAVTYLSYFQDINYGWMAYSMPMNISGPGTFGVSFGYLTLGGIEKRGLTDTDAADSLFGASDMQVALSYAFKDVVEGLSLGTNIKMVTEAIDTVRATGFAVDLGAFMDLKDLIPDLTASIALQNLGTGLKFTSINDPFPTNIKTGVAIKLLDKTLMFATDADYNLNDAKLSYRVGMEYWLQGMIAPRIGYGLAPTAGLSGLGAGLGIKLSELNLDYAFLPQGDLGNTHRVTLGYKF